MKEYVKLSIENYEHFKQCEENLEKRVVFKEASMYGYKSIYTDDEAIKEMAEIIQKQKDEISLLRLNPRRTRNVPKWIISICNNFRGN